MTKLISPAIFSITLFIIALATSCQKVETEFDCGEVATEIIKLDQVIGAYAPPEFYTIPSSNFVEAAIAIEIEQMDIKSERECFAFTPLPQIIARITITSSESVFSGGEEYAPGEDLSTLFAVHNMEQTYSISEFINTQTNDPLVFHADDQGIILQLFEKPDERINQSFSFQMTFTDSKSLTVEIPEFTVGN